MNIRSGFLAVVLGTLAALTAVSCGGPSEPVIGVIVPETGRGAVYGASVKAGIDLAVEEVNAGGGIEGQPLRVIYWYCSLPRPARPSSPAGRATSIGSTRPTPWRAPAWPR